MRGVRALEAREVGRTRPFLVYPSHHRLARPGPVNPEQFQDEAFIAYSEDSRLRELQLAALAQLGVVPKRMYAGVDYSRHALAMMRRVLPPRARARYLRRRPRRVRGVVPPSGTCWKKGKRNSAHSTR